MRRSIPLTFALIVIALSSAQAAEHGLQNDQDMDWQNDAEAVLHHTPISPFQAAIDNDHARLNQQRQTLAEDHARHAPKARIRADEAAIKASQQELLNDQKACSAAAMKAANAPATPPSQNSPDLAACRY